MTGVYKMHENDPNFPHLALRKIKNFISGYISSPLHNGHH